MAEPEEDPPSHGEPFTLGPKRIAKEVYDRLVLSSNREAVCDRARELAELTCHEVFPPQSYRVGDDMPGNNQSLGSFLLCNLASVLAFIAFPPGQPIMKLEALDYKMQQAVTANPKLWGQMVQSLSRLELAHRQRFQTTVMATAYEEYAKILLLAGNALWKHLKLATPTYHLPDCYVVKRARDGTPLLIIHEERCSLMALDKDVQDLLREEGETPSPTAGSGSPDTLDLGGQPSSLGTDKDEWDREVVIFSVQKLITDDKGEHSWAYWQETDKGQRIPDTEIETDYETPPMWAGQLIPRSGSSWGFGYCHRYRGDLFSLENHWSALNDGASAAAWLLALVKPGSASNIKQVRGAPNLSVLPGVEGDISFVRTDKSADFNFVGSQAEQIGRRLSRAFLSQASVQRDGERVTKEEIQRLGVELDKAMGGLYTSIAQGSQRPILLRAMALHEAEKPELPKLVDLEGIEVSVITGQDAMGASDEEQSLVELGREVAETFTNPTVSEVLTPLEWVRRLAAAKGIKTDGLVPSDDEFAQAQADKQKQGAMSTLMDKGTGPAVKGLADAAMAQQQQPPAGAQ